MKTPKCEYCLQQGQIRNRTVEDGCVFCMTLWHDVDPDKSCSDCANNADFTNGEEDNG